MKNSTKEFVKWSILKLMEQYDINLWDIEKCCDELRYRDGRKGYHDVEEYYKDYDINDADLNKEDLIQKILEYGKEVDNLHTHTNID